MMIRSQTLLRSYIYQQQHKSVNQRSNKYSALEKVEEGEHKTYNEVEDPPELGVSNKTPTTNPQVIAPQQAKHIGLGGVKFVTKANPTVMGNTNPLAI